MATRTATTRTSTPASFRLVGALSGVQHISDDYAIHRTGVYTAAGNGRHASEAGMEGDKDDNEDDDDDRIDPTVEPHPRVEGIVQPAWWPSDRFRDVPEYAPINRNLDCSRRPIGATPVISVLLTMTFTGNAILQSQLYAKIWRSTVEVFTDQMFRYPVGGEY
ncbi:hypothetical protein Sste5344_001466 [Sporothrix stenoceras]